MSRINAQLVADSLGLPEAVKTTADGGPWLIGLDGISADDEIDITDHQTYAGLLRQLAMWCGDDGEAQAYALVRFDYGDDQGFKLVRAPDPGDLACAMVSVALVDFGGSAPHLDPTVPWHRLPGDVPPNHTEALAAILTAIGLDHRIRRALGWTVTPGELARLAQAHDDFGPMPHWELQGPNGERHAYFATGLVNTSDYTIIQALNLDMTEAEAKQAIYDEVPR